MVPSLSSEGFTVEEITLKMKLLSHLLYHWLVTLEEQDDDSGEDKKDDLVIWKQQIVIISHYHISKIQG